MLDVIDQSSNDSISALLSSIRRKAEAKFNFDFLDVVIVVLRRLVSKANHTRTLGCCVALLQNVVNRVYAALFRFLEAYVGDRWIDFLHFDLALHLSKL